MDASCVGMAVSGGDGAASRHIRGRGRGKKKSYLVGEWGGKGAFEKGGRS